MGLTYLDPVRKGLSIFMEDWSDWVNYTQWSGCNLWLTIDCQKLGGHKRGGITLDLLYFIYLLSKLLQLV